MCFHQVAGAVDCVFVKLLTGKLCLCSLTLEFMALKNLVGKIYRCLHEVCTTFGGSTEVQLDSVSFTRFPFTTNQCYFMLNKLKDELCSSTLLTLISERKIYNTNPPSCAARENMTMICGQKTTFPSCVARQNMAMICGQKTTLSSCVARQNMAITCGKKTTLSSCVARQNMAMICGCKTNLSSCSFGYLILPCGDNKLQPICDGQLSSGRGDEVISNKIGAFPKSGNQVNGKFSTESHTRPSCEASINYSLKCGNTNCIIACPGHIENSDGVVKHSDKVQSAIETNQKRKRD